MQSDVDTLMSGDQSDGDQDSLFGSPPSSPGRSQSPALALPGASDTTQNVGTIALPGSHHYSEHPVNPLAPPLNHVTRVSSAQHIAPSPQPASQEKCLIAPSSLPGSRASSAGFLTKPRKQKRKSQQPTPRPPPPEITLPDPSAPVPANFLRNQSALLGVAGLIGGVKPADLSVHHTRGASPSNPIVVDEEITGTGPTLHRPHSHTTNPSALPAPLDDIVSMLIRQKDLFPVLQSLLKLVAAASGSHSLRTSIRTSSHTTQSTATSIPSSSGPPPKKRKLSRVPAGAADWDVPYPFLPGQGPDSYQTTWERERSKQLISQLTNLIKSAIGTATARRCDPSEPIKRAKSRASSSSSSYSKFEAEPKVCGHYRLSTTTYGVPSGSMAVRNAQAQQVTNDTRNNSKISAPKVPLPNQIATATTSEQQPPATLDQLVASLLAATPQSILPHGTGSAHLAADRVNMSCVDPKTLPVLGSSTMDSQNIDQSTVDSWINILQTFPMSVEAFSQAYGSQPEAQSGTSSSAGDEEFDFFAFDRNHAHAGSSSLSSGNATSSTEFGFIPWPPNQPNPSGTTSSIDALPIDPTLLTISLSQLNPITAVSVDNLPSLAPSPMPSLTSSSDTGLDTPTSVPWGISAPEIYKGASGDRPTGLDYQTGEPARQGDKNGSEGFVGADASYDVPTANEGKSKNTADHSSEPLPSRSLPMTQVELKDLAGNPTTVPQDRVMNVVTATKAEVVRRAEERKKQLIAEINNVKTQLWETTIEQGILSHINKHYRHIP